VYELKVSFYEERVKINENEWLVIMSLNVYLHSSNDSSNKNRKLITKNKEYI